VIEGSVRISVAHSLVCVIGLPLFTNPTADSTG